MTPKRLRELFDYDPDTGAFTWKVSRGNQVFKGRQAGHIQKRHGYVEIKVDGKRYQGHRLIWLYHYGKWPSDMLDHINGISSDNRICNLREATNAENQQNRKVRRNNKSGLIGVSWCSQYNNWQAQIAVAKKRFHLGRFGSAERAHEVYLEAKRKFHTFNPTIR